MTHEALSAGAAYGLMLRLMGYAYAVPAPHPDKALAVDLSLGLMRAVTYLGEHAARSPAGPSNPHCNRATLCRCGASKNKPFCDSSHHDIAFTATGEPASGTTDMLPVRDGVLAIDPQADGPLQVCGNLEITSGTGRVVARVTTARLCRCGGSETKPFCDGTHARNGFRS